MTDYIVYYLQGVCNLFKPTARLRYLNCYTLLHSRYLVTVSRTPCQFWSCRRWGYRVQCYAVWHCVSYQSFGGGDLPHCVLSSKSCTVNLVDIYEPCVLTNSVTDVHKIRHFELLLFWTHVTDWSTDDPGAAEQCRSPVGKARNSNRRHI